MVRSRCCLWQPGFGPKFQSRCFLLSRYRRHMVVLAMQSGAPFRLEQVACSALPSRPGVSTSVRLFPASLSADVRILSNQSKGECSITTLGRCCNGRAGQCSSPSLADERGLMTDEQQASVALPPIVSIFAGRDAPCQVAARSRPQPCARLGRFAANCKDRRRCEGRLARSRRESSPAFLLDSPFIVRQPVPPYAEVA